MEQLEKRDLYDINRNLTGETIYKGEKIPENRYILVVVVFIQNSKGEFLIQKRSYLKNNKYACTSGHAKSGETSIQAIISEIKEELNINVQESELDLIYSGRNDYDQVFFDVYYMNKDYDINSFTLQKEEVDFVEWDPLDKIIKLIEDDKFLPSHGEDVYRLINIFKNRGIDIK